MPVESATTGITLAVTVAGGVFAPGHLGELTQCLPFEQLPLRANTAEGIDGRARW